MPVGSLGKVPVPPSITRAPFACVPVSTCILVSGVLSSLAPEILSGHSPSHGGTAWHTVGCQHYLLTDEGMEGCL